MGAFAQRVVRGQRAGYRIVCRRGQDTVNVEFRGFGQTCTDVQTGGLVVGGRRRAVRVLDGTAVVREADRRSRGARCRSVYRDVETGARLAFVACCVGQGVGQDVGAFAQRVVRGQRAGYRIVGRRGQDTVNVQLGCLGQTGTDVQTGGLVVGARRRAVRVLHRTAVVREADRRSRCARGGGVYRDIQRAALSTFDAGLIGERIAQCVGAVCQRRAGRQGTGCRVVSGGNQCAIHI